MSDSHPAQPAPTRAVTPPQATGALPKPQTSSPVSAVSVPAEASSSRAAPPQVPQVPAPAVAPAAPAPAATSVQATTNALTTMTPNDLLAQADEKNQAMDKDPHWMFKIGGRAVLIIVGLIGLGCIAWAFSTAPRSSGYYYYYSYDTEERWALPWALITFTLSIVWSAICIFVYLFRSRPVHPGLAVAFDLILWLGIIPTALFALVALTSLKSWGADGSLGYSSYGEYNLASNGTWVWQWDERTSDPDSYYYEPERSCNSTSSSSSYRENRFSSCEEEETFINEYWQDKPQRERVVTAGVACQFISLVVHFALFVWACVDTNIRNRTKVNKDAEKLAAGIVMNMVRNGAIIPPPGQAHMRPPPGMYPVYAQQPMPGQYYPQQMPGQPQIYPQPYPTAPPQAPAAGVNEKSQGVRYT